MTNCEGNMINNNHTTIHNGCGNTIINNDYLHNFLPDIFNENQTYFEISECGGAWPPQWLITLFYVAIVLVPVCFCLCGCFAIWWCSFRRKRKRKKAETDNLINHEMEPLGYETNSKQ